MKKNSYTEFTVSGTQEAFVLVCDGKERLISSKEAKMLSLKLKQILGSNISNYDILISRQLLVGGNDTEMLLIKRETALRAWYFFKRALKIM